MTDERVLLNGYYNFDIMYILSLEESNVNKLSKRPVNSLHFNIITNISLVLHTKQPFSFPLKDIHRK